MLFPILLRPDNLRVAHYLGDYVNNGDGDLLTFMLESAHFNLYYVADVGDQFLRAEGPVQLIKLPAPSMVNGMIADHILSWPVMRLG